MGGYFELPRAQRVPEYHEESPESRTIIAALSDGALAARDAAEDAGAQMRVSTATWGLALWEELTGIETDETRSDEERRTAITARLCGSGTCNAEMIARIARMVTGYEGVVIEQTDQYRFSLSFVGDRLEFAEFDLDAIRAAVEEVKPAHLEFVISRITWGDLDSAGLTWAELEEVMECWGDFDTKTIVKKRG